MSETQETSIHEILTKMDETFSGPADGYLERAAAELLDFEMRVRAEERELCTDGVAPPPATDFERDCVESMRHNAQRMREQCRRERSRAESAEAKLAELRARVKSVCRKLVAPIPHECERYGACSQCMIDSQREDLARELLGDAAIDAMKGKP